jgi:hypothetical protein
MFTIFHDIVTDAWPLIECDEVLEQKTFIASGGRRKGPEGDGDASHLW